MDTSTAVKRPVLTLIDASGFIFLDYRQPFRLMELWFGLARAGGLVGSEVTATGWYRRAPMPFFELRTLEVGGVVRRCWVRAAKLCAGAVAIVIGRGQSFEGESRNRICQCCVAHRSPLSTCLSVDGIQHACAATE